MSVFILSVPAAGKGHEAHDTSQGTSLASPRKAVPSPPGDSFVWKSNGKWYGRGDTFLVRFGLKYFYDNCFVSPHFAPWGYGGRKGRIIPTSTFSFSSSKLHSSFLAGAFVLKYSGDPQEAGLPTGMSCHWLEMWRRFNT